MATNKENDTIRWIPDTCTNYLHVCRRCGATSPNKTHFKCSNCGRHVEEEENYCPSCGKEWEE